MLESLGNFWERHPALLYGTVVFLACECALQWNPALLIPLLFIFFPLCFIYKKGTCRLLLALALGVSYFCFIKTNHAFPAIPFQNVKGHAEVELHTLSQPPSPFGKRWMYKGTLLSFTSQESSLRNLPIIINLPLKTGFERPLANRSYLIQGHLKVLSPHSLALIPEKNVLWQPIKGSWSLAEYRFQTKKKLKSILQKKIKNSQSAAFLSGLATGEFDQPLMMYEFSRFGLQHIMAISGFHFAILAAITDMLFRFLLPRRYASALLILLLSCYFIFLGCSPSIMRAWSMIVIGLCGFLFQKRGSGLNSLGLALLIILFYDPFACCSMGFLFSFATTAAILLLFSPMDAFLQKAFATRPLSIMCEADTITQHGYCAMIILRKGLALTLAINIVALPMTLYFFHKFPLMGLVHNLFFPFLVCISMFLLLAGLSVGLFTTVLGDFIHGLNSSYTQFVLNFTFNIPASMDIVWRSSALSTEVMIALASGIFFAAIIARDFCEKRQETSRDLIFV